MFVSRGGAQKILQQRKKDFYDGFIVRLLEEAKKLHLSKEDVIRMIEEGKTDE